MALINNKKIELYDLDSVNSVLTRVEADMNTIPELIYFPNGVPTNIGNLSDINVIDLKPIIENASSLKEIYNYTKNIQNMRIKMDLYTLIQYYIIFNKNIKDIFTIEDESFISLIIDDKISQILSELKSLEIEHTITKEKIEDIFTTTKSISKNIDKKLEKTKEKAENILLDLENFKKIEGNNYTKFEEEILKFELEFKIKNISSLLEIFNLIKLNSNIPFAATHNFYKIYKEFTPPIQWKNLFDKTKSFNKQYKNLDRNTNIIFKILVQTKKKIEVYSEGVLKFNNGIISVSLEYNIKNIPPEMLENNKYRNSFINKFLSIFDMEYDKNSMSIITKEIRGRFYFPYQSMNKYVLMDLILNDYLFSSLIGIKEKKISKKESIYIYFENQTTGNITATITPQISTNQNFNIEHDELFPINSEYINIKISHAESLEKVNKFQNIFAKLFSIYNEKIEDIVEYYNKFNISLEPQVAPEEDDDDEFDDDENKLIKVDPYVFKTGYNTYCQKGHKPTNISEEKAKIAEEEGKSVLLFPREKTGKSIPKYYICNHEKYAYPGLKKNHLDNKDLFPYIPCCYPVPQINKSKYKEYYFGEKIVEQENTGQNVFLTRKILKDREYGILPDNINKMFSIINKNGKFFRRGVERNYSSFLSCILTALNIKYTNINNVRQTLAKPELAAVCKQELYDYTINEIIEKIKDPNIYFDPKLFLHLIEAEYKCNIFIFNDTNDGELILPRHIKGYYKTKNKNKTILIYEHMGSKEDKALYPQCEFIFLHPDETSDSVENTFKYDSIISKKILDIFNELNYSYIINKKIPFSDFNWPWKKNIIPLSQYIDSYGKTRLINIKYENEYVSILTTPIQPLKLKNDGTKYTTTILTALKLIKYLEINNYKQVLNENNYIKELTGVIGNINIKILLDEKTPKIDRLDVDDVIDFDNVFESSIIDKFNKHKKIARYATEYIYWLFSNYINNEKLDYENITQENYKNFKDKYILIDKDFVYENVPKMFSLENSGLILNQKLVVKSEESLKRLFYILRLMLIRNSKKLISFYNQQNIENYYIDITDFDYYNTQIILQGEGSILKLINEKNNINKVYNKILLNYPENEDKKVKQNKEDIDIDIEDEEEDDEEEDDEINIEDQGEKKFKKMWNVKPYFFKNKLINNNKMYIAQNIDTFMKGIKIAVSWNQNNFNPGTNVKDCSVLEEFTLYSFKNENNIKVYNVEGKSNDFNIKIIGYKIDFDDSKKSLYTVLLPI
jgi:hypothetical protein